MMTLNVKLFAVVRDLVGKRELTISLPSGSSAERLLDHLMTAHPQLEPWRTHLRLAVNNEYISVSEVLHDADEVALIPPVSGG